MYVCKTLLPVITCIIKSLPHQPLVRSLSWRHTVSFSWETTKFSVLNSLTHQKACCYKVLTLWIPSIDVKQMPPCRRLHYINNNVFLCYILQMHLGHCYIKVLHLGHHVTYKYCVKDAMLRISAAPRMPCYIQLLHLGHHVIISAATRTPFYISVVHLGRHVTYQCCT